MDGAAHGRWRDWLLPCTKSGKFPAFADPLSPICHCRPVGRALAARSGLIYCQRSQKRIQRGPENYAED